MFESDTENTISAQQMSELDTLKARADLMMIKYNPNIGVDKLKLKIQAALDAVDNEQDPKAAAEAIVDLDAGVVTPTPTPVQAKPVAPVQTKAQRNTVIRDEAKKLIRIRVACMNPNKREWEGELFSASNSVIGTVKQFIPFNNEAGWHVAHILVDILRTRKCQIFVTKIDSKGRKVRKGKMIQEYSVEVLPPLSTKELDDLAKQQAMSGSIDRDDD